MVIQNRIFTILLITALLIVVIIAGGTVYAFCSGMFPQFSESQSPKATMVPISGVPVFADFSGLGTIRLLSGGDKPCTVIAAPYFRYDPADTLFTEELAKKTRRINDAISEWFAEQPAEKLLRMDESYIKEQVATVINQCLVLGKIETVYFDEFLIVE